MRIINTSQSLIRTLASAAYLHTYSLAYLLFCRLVYKTQTKEALPQHKHRKRHADKQHIPSPIRTPASAAYLHTYSLAYLPTCLLVHKTRTREALP